MDLKSGGLYWPGQSKQIAKPAALEKDISCDVAIIGAGLTGALLAYALGKEGIDTVVLDKRGIAAGSTSASTALILYEIDVPLFELIRRNGQEKAVRSYQLCLRTIDQLKQTVGKLEEPCGFAPRSSLYLARRKQDVPKLRREFAARKNFGFNVEFLSRREIEQRTSFSRPAALLAADAAEINPHSFTQCLAKSAMNSGARVFAGVTVRQIEHLRKGVILRTDLGYRVSARKLIVAAGYESVEFFRRKLVRLKSTYVLTTEPVKDFNGWPNKCLIWETGHPYYYLRTTADARLMIGGADEDFVNPAKRDQLIQKKARLLQRRLEKMFPEIEIAPAFAWAGTFGETADGLPYIGCLPSSKNILFALCYGANGTNFAMLAANIAHDWVREKPNPDAELFALDRE